MLQQDEIIVLVGLTQKQISRLPGNIIGISSTNNVQELVEIYSAADVFLNPTMEEVFGMTNLEAQACGTYTITFESGGTGETILNSSLGTICPEKDSKGLREKMDKFREARPDLNHEFFASTSIQALLPQIDKHAFSQTIMDIYQKQISKTPDSHHIITM